MAITLITNRDKTSTEITAKTSKMETTLITGRDKSSRVITGNSKMEITPITGRDRISVAIMGKASKTHVPAYIQMPVSHRHNSNRYNSRVVIKTISQQDKTLHYVLIYNPFTCQIKALRHQSLNWIQPDGGLLYNKIMGTKKASGISADAFFIYQ